MSKVKLKISSIWKSIASISNINPTSLKKGGIYSISIIKTKTKDNIKYSLTVYCPTVTYILAVQLPNKIKGC